MTSDVFLISANTASSFACTDSYIGSGFGSVGSGSRFATRPV